MSIEEDPKCGRPSMSMDDDHVEKVLAVIRQNRRLIVHEVAEEAVVCKNVRASWFWPTNWRCVVLPQNLYRVLWQTRSLSVNFWRIFEATVVPQLPYSPDLAPADFFLFPKFKSSLKGSRFQTVEEIEENSIRDLRAIPQNTFHDAFQNWKKKKKTLGAVYKEWRGVL